MEWTQANLHAAHDDGWWFSTDRRQRRWLSHYGHRHADLKAVHRHIVERGLEGSPLHLKALALLYAGNKREFLSVMKELPPNKTGALVKTVIMMARMAGITKGEP